MQIKASKIQVGCTNGSHTLIADKDLCMHKSRLIFKYVNACLNELPVIRARGHMNQPFIPSVRHYNSDIHASFRCQN